MELFKLLGTIAVDNAQAKQAIDETASTADNGTLKVVFLTGPPSLTASETRCWAAAKPGKKPLRPLTRFLTLRNTQRGNTR